MFSFVFTFVEYSFGVFCFWGVWKCLDIIWNKATRRFVMEDKTPDIIPIPIILKFEESEKSPSTKNETPIIIPFNRDDPQPCILKLKRPGAS